MILSRITTAIRTQNWFAVVLEFIIVIAGVVIGFQVSAWAQARADAEREALMLSRLHGEAETNVLYFSREVVLRREADERRDGLIQRMLASDFGNIAPRELIDGIFTAGNLLEPTPSRVVYDEIVSAGLTSRIGDEAMRTALAQYWSELDSLRTYNERRREEAYVFPRAVAAQDEFVRIEYDPEHGLRRRYSIDPEQAAQSQDFMDFVLFSNTRSRMVTLRWSEALNRAIVLCHETARLTERSCEAAAEIDP